MEFQWAMGIYGILDSGEGVESGWWWLCDEFTLQGTEGETQGGGEWTRENGCFKGSLS